MAGLRAVCGDELGLVKVVGLGKEWGANGKGRVVATHGACRREHGVEALAWADKEDWRSGVVWATRSGELRFGRGAGPETARHAEGSAAAEGSAQDVTRAAAFGDTCCGLEVMDGQLATCSKTGTVHVVKFDCRAPPGQAFEGGVVKTYERGGPISKMRRSAWSGHFAFGGEENDLSLWDMEKDAVVFKARNVKNDFLDLRVPVWPTDMCFMEITDATSKPSFSGAAADVVAVCTAFSEVRLYDTRAQRKPVSWKAFGRATDLRQNNNSASSHHMTCIVATSPHCVIVGDAAGEVFQVDLRKMEETGRYKAFAGSVRALYKHPTLPLVASACIDRHLRVHNTETRKLESILYVKQRLKAVLFSPEEPASNDQDDLAAAEALREARPTVEDVAGEEDVVEEFVVDAVGADSDEERPGASRRAKKLNPKRKPGAPKSAKLKSAKSGAPSDVAAPKRRKT